MYGNGTDFASLANTKEIEKIMRFLMKATKSFVHEWNSSVPLHVREAETDARKAFFTQVFLVCAYKNVANLFKVVKLFT